MKQAIETRGLSQQGMTDRALIQSILMSKISQFGSRLASYIGSSFYVDGEKIANAFQFNMTEEELQRLMLAMSGKGGDTILATCQAVLKDEFPALYEKVEVMLPDEKTRRVGQSAAAASLPAIN